MFSVCRRCTRRRGQEAKAEYDKQGQASLRIVSGKIKLDVITSLGNSFIERQIPYNLPI